MRRLKTFWLLGLQDKTAFFRAWLCLVAAKLSLRFIGLARTTAWLVPAMPATPQDPWPRSARWLPVAIRYCPGGDHCLGRSIALLALLRRSGVACDLRIGVRRGEPNVEAHAWVEVNGTPVNDARDVAQRYNVFDQSPPSKRGAR